MGKEANNIFGLAGSQRPKREVKAQSAPPPAPSPEIPESERLPPVKKPLPQRVRDPEIAEALAKIKFMHDDLESKVQMVYSRMGLTKSTIKQMLDNPKNYERVQMSFQSAQVQRQILRQEIIKMVGKGVLEAIEGKVQQKELDRHKKKSLGSRKNWLNMR